MTIATRLRKLREEAIANGMKLLSAEEIDALRRDCPNCNAALSAKERAEEEVERLRKLINIDSNYPCLPECDSEGHAENCPWANPERAWSMKIAECERLWKALEWACEHADEYVTVHEEVSEEFAIELRRRAKEGE